MKDDPAFGRELGALRRMLGDVFDGMRAGDALLRRHSRPDERLTATNFPQEENLLHEMVDLLAGWKAGAAELLRRLDTATTSANLDFERLFDENAGRQSEGFLRRRTHLRQAAPKAIGAELVSLLSASAVLGRILQEARPSIVECHRNCEDCLLQLATRRRQIDVSLEELGRRMEQLKAQTRMRQTSGSFRPHAADDEASEEERRSLALDRHAVQSKEETARAERETLHRLMADDEDCVEALNAGIAAVNAMAAKLKVDIEGRVALLKAVCVQAAVDFPELPGPVAALVTAFEADILAGHDLLQRKQRADDAFARRMTPPLPPPAEWLQEAGEAEAAAGA